MTVTLLPDASPGEPRRIAASPLGTPGWGQCRAAPLPDPHLSPRPGSRCSRPPRTPGANRGPPPLHCSCHRGSWVGGFQLQLTGGCPTASYPCLIPGGPKPQEAGRCGPLPPAPVNLTLGRTVPARPPPHPFPAGLGSFRLSLQTGWSRTQL